MTLLTTPRNGRCVNRILVSGERMDDDHAACRARIRQLEAQARRDTDRINDAEETARVYRRLALRLLNENEAQSCKTEPR